MKYLLALGLLTSSTAFAASTDVCDSAALTASEKAAQAAYGQDGAPHLIGYVLKNPHEQFQRYSISYNNQDLENSTASFDVTVECGPDVSHFGVRSIKRTK